MKMVDSHTYCCHAAIDDTICDPQFYPNLKQRAKTADGKNSSSQTKQQQLPIYKCPGPAYYSLNLDSIKQRAPSFSFARRPTQPWSDGSPGPKYNIQLSDSKHSKGPYLHGSRPLPTQSSSPGPAAYFVDGNVTRKGKSPGYVHLNSSDYSMGWRGQREKFVINDSKESYDAQT